MTEQQIQKKIFKYLISVGAYVIKVISASKAGVPDIICCYKGIFIAIEVKTPGTRDNVSALQQYNLEQVMKAGGLTLVAWEVEQVEELICNLKNIK